MRRIKYKDIPNIRSDEVLDEELGLTPNEVQECRWLISEWEAPSPRTSCAGEHISFERQEQHIMEPHYVVNMIVPIYVYTGNE